MTNEQRVEEIRNGVSVTANMERLYTDNLPLIRRFIKPYTGYESEEDLLQEAYFGLYEAVQRYETSENVLFMTYAMYWIRQGVQQYLDNYGSVVRFPANYRQKISRYHKSMNEYQQIYGRAPTVKELAGFMELPVKEVERIRTYASDIQSMDAPLKDDDGFCLSDMLQSDLDVENSVTDKLYDEYQKSELWGIVERYTDNWQQEIIRQHFWEGKPIARIARESGKSTCQIRAQKDKGLRRLQTSRAIREIRDKLEILDAGIYRTGVNQFKNHGYTSIVECTAIRRAEIEELFKNY